MEKKIIVLISLILLSACSPMQKKQYVALENSWPQDAAIVYNAKLIGMR